MSTGTITALQAHIEAELNVPNLDRDPEIDSALAFDPDLVAAKVIRALAGAPHLLPVKALEQMARRNEALAKNIDAEIADTLSRQVSLLEAVELAFLAKAAAAKRPEHASLYAKVAFTANRALVGVLSALKVLKDEQKDAQALDA